MHEGIENSYDEDDSIDERPDDSSIDERPSLLDTSNHLFPHRKILCPQDNGKDAELVRTAKSNHDDDFISSFPPAQMKYLALVSHNGMKSTMKRFVLANKNILKKFCLTGTNSTMTMLKEVIGKDDPDVVYGPSCSSGPLGGDAELAALMTQGKVGGIIFFTDPMSAHPHQADIDGLCRLAMVHNTMLLQNPTTAVMMMDILRSSLKEKRPDMMPSFFFDLVSPSVSAYKEAQKQTVLDEIADGVSVANTSIGTVETLVKSKPQIVNVRHLTESSPSAGPKYKPSVRNRQKVATEAPLSEVVISTSSTHDSDASLLVEPARGSALARTNVARSRSRPDSSATRTSSVATLSRQAASRNIVRRQGNISESMPISNEQKLALSKNEHANPRTAKLLTMKKNVNISGHTLSTLDSEGSVDYEADLAFEALEATKVGSSVPTARLKSTHRAALGARAMPRWRC